MGDTLGVVSNLAAIDPSVWDNYDLDLWARDTARVTGASKRYVRDPKDVEQRRQDRAEQQQAVQQQQAALTGSETAKNLSTAQESLARSGINAGTA